MKLNTKEKLKELNGNAIKQNDEELTLGTIVANALMTPVEGDTGETKCIKYNLGVKCVSLDEFDITPEEAVVIKESVAKPFSPLIVGQVWAYLDGKDGKG